MKTIKYLISLAILTIGFSDLVATKTGAKVTSSKATRLNTLLSPTTANLDFNLGYYFPNLDIAILLNDTSYTAYNQITLIWKQNQSAPDPKNSYVNFAIINNPNYLINPKEKNFINFYGIPLPSGAPLPATSPETTVKAPTGFIDSLSTAQIIKGTISDFNTGLYIKSDAIAILLNPKKNSYKVYKNVTTATSKDAPTLFATQNSTSYYGQLVDSSTN